LDGEHQGVDLGRWLWLGTGITMLMDVDSWSRCPYGRGGCVR
jgi:hypothetical protein